MKDFILAAAPWVLCGISIALLAAKGASKEKLSAGASAIMLLGTALGAAFASALGMSTRFGSILDSVSDIVFLIACAIKLIPELRLPVCLLASIAAADDLSKR